MSILLEQQPASDSSGATPANRSHSPPRCFGEPLPPAVGDRNSLSPHGRALIAQLERRDPFRFCLTLAGTWVAIIGAIAVASYLQNPVVSLLAICFVATRQNVLGLLMHEQCHRLGFYSKVGDTFCNFTICYPLFITLEGYRRVHLAHHQNYFSERDPDYRRKQGPAWTFPQRVGHLLKLFLKDLLGFSIWGAIRGKAGETVELPQRADRWQTSVRIAYYLVVLGLIIWTGAWTAALVYWVIPLCTVLQVIVRWGAICEHKYDLLRPGVIESTPIIEPRWWQNLLLPNLNFTLHIYHHWFPRIPFARLPEVHQLFRREGLVIEENVFQGYGAYLRYLLCSSDAVGRSGN